MQQRLRDLGQFLALNSEAAQEKLDGAERRIRDLEAELASSQTEHTERLATLEERLALYVKAAATDPAAPAGSQRAAPSPAQQQRQLEQHQQKQRQLEQQLQEVRAEKEQLARERDQERRRSNAAVLAEAAPAAAAVASGGAPVKRSRDEIVAERRAAAEKEKTDKLAALQAEIDRTMAHFKARSLDEGRRLAELHVPKGKHPVTAKDLVVERYHGGLRDILLNSDAKIGICPIEKVASSELKKLLLRMLGDPKWRDEPWFKGGIHKIKFEKKLEGISHIIDSPTWTKAVFLRHPFDRLVSCYKDKFGRDNKLYSVQLTGNKSTHLLKFHEFLEIITAPGCVLMETREKKEEPRAIECCSCAVAARVPPLSQTI